MAVCLPLVVLYGGLSAEETAVSHHAITLLGGGAPTLHPVTVTDDGECLDGDDGGDVDDVDVLSIAHEFDCVKKCDECPCDAISTLDHTYQGK